MATIRDSRGTTCKVAPAGSYPPGSRLAWPGTLDLGLAQSQLVLSPEARTHHAAGPENSTAASPFDVRSAKNGSKNAKDVASAPSKISALVKLVKELKDFEEVGGETASAAEGAEVATEEIEEEVETAEASGSAAGVAPVAAAGSTAEAAAAGAPAPVEGSAIGKAGAFFKTGLGILGTAAGAAQAAYGGTELRDGKTLNGAADILGGGLNLTAGVSQLSSTVSGGVAGALRSVGAVDAIGSKVPVAGPLAGAAAVIGGGVQIYQGFEQHNSEKAALGGVKAVAGGIMVAGAFLDGTIAGAPAGVALNAAGGVMLLGAAAWENRKSIEGWVSSGSSWVGHELSQL